MLPILIYIRLEISWFVIIPFQVDVDWDYQVISLLTVFTKWKDFCLLNYENDFVDQYSRRKVKTLTIFNKLIFKRIKWIPKK